MQIKEVWEDVRYAAIWLADGQMGNHIYDVVYEEVKSGVFTKVAEEVLVWEMLHSDEEREAVDD